MKRRTFLGLSGTSALAGLSATIGGATRMARADRMNDKVVLGMIGLGSRGRDVAHTFARREDVEVAYLCDVDDARIGSYPRQIEGLQGRAPRAVKDMRRIFDDKDVDAVLIATCDHWHALAAIWACQAGKDVYVEKPACHNIWEGRKMVEAARKYECVVQVGTQNRSAPYIHEAREYIRSGALGEIPLVKVYNMKPGEAFTCPPDSPVPEGVDYDLYLGPAPKRPFNAGHFHEGWVYYWAYGAGDAGNDGVHQMDIARLLLGDPGPPKAANASGGGYALHDDKEVPDVQVASFEYDERVVTFELTGYPPYMRKTPSEIRDTDRFPYWPSNATRIELYGTKNLMYVGRMGGGWQVHTAEGEIVTQIPGRYVAEEHVGNFIDCVRSRKRPNADIEIGHQSVLPIHLANIGTHLGGRRVVFDRDTESIRGDEEANALLRRTYRAGFEVPEQV